MEGIKDKTLTILHFNDCYRLQEHKEEPLGGTARFTTAIRSFDHLNPLKFFAGDLFSPSDMTIIYEGRQMVLPVNEMKLTAACLGNHDFDLEYDDLLDRLKETNFPWIMSNFFLRDTKLPVGNSKEYMIFERNKLRVGVIGLAEREWLETLLTMDEDNIMFMDPIECAKELSKRLRESEKCDIVIALTHMRVPNDQLLARSVPELDFILGAHDHIIHIENLNDVVIIKSGSDFRTLGHLTLEEIPDGTTPDPEVLAQKGTFFNKKKYLITANIIEVTSKYEPNPVVQKHIDECVVALKKEMDALVGYTACDLEGRFSEIRSHETNLANFLGDLFLGYTDADFLLINTGSIRIDKVIPKGPLLLGDIQSTLPFEDSIEELELPGSIVKDILENAVSKFPALEGRFPFVSQITFAFDSRKETGNRVDPTSIKIRGHPLRTDKKYKMATRSFLASQGKDGYSMLPKLKTLQCEESGIEMKKVILHFFGFQSSQSKEAQKKDGDQPMRRESSLSIKTKCAMNNKKLIAEYVEKDKKYIVVNPKVEARIVNLAQQQSQ